MRTKAGSRFIAITDPGSKMQQVAETDRFRHIFFGLPSIGGRYSALSDFGMVPGAVMGLDVEEVSRRAEEMVHACASCVPVEKIQAWCLVDPGQRWRRTGRDKVTIIASPGIYDLGAWLEQLLAESTGKEGKGLIPVDREAAWRAGGLRQRSRVRLSSPESRTGCRAGREPSRRWKRPDIR